MNRNDEESSIRKKANDDGKSLAEEDRPVHLPLRAVVCLRDAVVGVAESVMNVVARETHRIHLLDGTVVAEDEAPLSDGGCYRSKRASKVHKAA